MATHEFVKLVSDFIADIFRTFPEYEEKQRNGELHNGYLACIEYQVAQDLSASFPDSIEDLHKQISAQFPQHFFDILYKNEEVVFKKESGTLLPSIDLGYLWSQELSTQTRETMWNYLNLFLFSVLGSANADSFGDTAKLFEAIDEDTLREKLKETVENMQTAFDMSGVDFSGNFTAEDMPNAEELQGHVEKMMGGKIGKLAKEIADETAQELDLDLSQVTDVNDVFKKLFQNPQKLMSMIHSIGRKLDDKKKAGEFKESELMEEAKQLMDQMKDMPGLKQFSKMMGGGMSGMPNFGAMQSQLNTNLRKAKMRERMTAKLEQRQTQFKNMGDNASTSSTTTKTSKFTVGEGATPYRTMRDFGEEAQRCLKKDAPKSGNAKKKKNKRKK